MRARAAGENVRRCSMAPASATRAATAKAAANICGMALLTVSVVTSPFERWLPTRRTAGAVAPMPAATGRSSANVRRRPGTSANTSKSITGVAYREPRLWPSRATSASSTAPPASAPRRAHGRRALRASRNAGQKAISHSAALALT